jgi:hypothetical protein
MNNIHFSDRTITYAQFLEDVSRKVAFLVEKRLNEKMTATPELASTEEAAGILGISPDRLRHIKDRFPHIKGGGEKQGRLLFVRDALLRQYAQ